LNVVICVVDYTEKSDDFIKAKVSLHEILHDYYLNYFIFMANSLSPISLFIAVVFITARMASHTEIIAIHNAGVSFFRFFLPYLIGALMVGIFSFFMVGWIIPNASKTKVAFELKYLRSPFYFDDRNIHLKADDSTYVYMESYNNNVNTGYRFTMERIVGNTLKSKISADRIEWDTLKKVWHTDRYRLHIYDGEKEIVRQYFNLDTSFNVTPKYFESQYKLHETLTFPELETHIQEEIRRGVRNVNLFLNEKYERYAYPFAALILTFMGVIVSARKSRKGSGGQIALGFFLACVFVLSVVMSRTIAEKTNIDPMISAWIPNLTFLTISIIMFFTLPRSY
ncbi:MAG: LptF/LptG family permease, partial [Flammeovirgaceae bacterium]|nr:LptF/LptG family permease [Flammeovirgaceae bacterium]MDW8287628.1 LptF/LptG family permease [Flammeovirgaceae bacterium]